MNIDQLKGIGELNKENVIPYSVLLEQLIHRDKKNQKI